MGVVLAGGDSRRMGRDKALLDVRGETLVERAARLMASVCPDSALAVRAGRSYPSVSLPVIEDRRLSAGPLAGIEAALSSSGGWPVLILACDLPRVDRTVLERLLAHADAAVAAAGPSAWLPHREGALQPLCGLYAAACEPLVTRRLDRGQRAVLDFVERLDVEAVSFDDVMPDPFINVNTPADFEHARGRAAAG